MWWIVLTAVVVFALALLYSILKVSAEADADAERWERELLEEQGRDRRAA
jgi:hypothetical protein